MLTSSAAFAGLGVVADDRLLVEFGSNLDREDRAKGKKNFAGTSPDRRVRHATSPLTPP